MGLLQFSTYKEIIHFNSGIRNRIDIINLLLGILDINSLRTFEQGNLKILFLQENKISRVFVYESEKSIHSFHFPFSISGTKGNYMVTEKEAFLPENVDNVIISFFKSIFNSRQDYETDIFNKDFLNFFDFFYEAYRNFFEHEEVNLNMIWNLYLKLLSFEPGYIRYDHDEVHVSNVHPLDHFDLNYSKNASFKIGLKGDLMIKKFKDFFMNVKYIE